MRSITSLTAQQHQLQEWARQIQECKNRPVGMTVKEWCSQQGISKANYYYRLRRLRQTCLDISPKDDTIRQVVPVSRAIPATVIPESTSRQGVTLNKNGVEIQVSSETDMQLLSKVLQVIAYAE